MKTTKKDFALFKKECEKWIEIFGLKGWRVYIEHKIPPKGKAWCELDLENRIATIIMNLDWDDDKCDYEIRKTAFHESCELLLGRMDVVSKWRHSSESEIDEARHEVIRILENVLWKNRKSIR
jgi:hypothetical protein